MSRKDAVVTEGNETVVTEGSEAVTTTETTLVRANKVTAYWEGDGVAVGAFYRTHNKIATVKSNDAQVVALGYAIPEGTDEVPVTAQQKLESFKTFIQVNASQLGILYDPVDRRSDEFKFPNKYDDTAFKEYSKKMLENVLGATLEKVQNNVIAGMVKSGNIADGTKISFGIGDGEVVITESYGNGSIKYGNAKYPVVIAVADKQFETVGIIDLVSGQLKKPRELADNVVITMTGIKTVLVENGLLPKIEKKAKETEDAVEGTDAVSADVISDATETVTE